MRIFELHQLPRVIHGKSPIFSLINNSLLYIDSKGKIIYNYNITLEEIATTMMFDQCINFIVDTNRTTADDIVIIVGLENKIIEVSITKLIILETIMTIPDHYLSKGLRLSSAIACPDGVLYVTMENINWRDGKRGSLFQVVKSKSSVDDESSNSQYTIRDVLSRDGIHLPRGMIWKNENVMYLVDAAESEIQILRFSRLNLDDPCSKKVVERRTVYKLPQSFIDFGYMLGGVDMDNKGKLWVAVHGGGMIVRIDPVSGREMFKLHLETKLPTDIRFGSENQGSSTLYITTSTSSNNSEADASIVAATLDRIQGMHVRGAVDTELATVIDSHRTQQLACSTIFCCAPPNNTEKESVLFCTL